jgi:rare lipoprotein A
MRYIIKSGTALLGLLALSACGGLGGDADVEQAPAAAEPPLAGVSDTPVRLGSPYQVGSVTYTPEDVMAYDEVGYASWYGADFSGRNTANGEVFLPSAISSAHKTLPMPSYVEITSLATGRTILARVNDRGPFANDRLIDLSEGAARQLGILDQGVSGVRVRKVNPPEQERAMLRNGQSASARMDTPESLLKVLRDKLAKLPKPQPLAAAPKPVSVKPGVAAPTKPAKPGDDRFVREGASVSSKPASRPTAAPPTASGYVVQVAAFSTRARADELARKLDADVVASADGRLFRVRFGPYASESEGRRALADAQKRGYPQARLFRE